MAITRKLACLYTIQNVLEISGKSQLHVLDVLCSPSGPFWHSKNLTFHCATSLYNNGAVHEIFILMFL